MSPIEPKQTKKGRNDSDTNGESRNDDQHDMVENCEVDSERTRKSKHQKVCEAWNFCKRWSKSVEVNYKNMDGHKVLTKIYFPFNPDVMKVHVLSIEIKISVTSYYFSKSFEKK